MKVVYIVFTTVGVLFILVGLLIKKTKKIEFINQTDELKEYDRVGLSTFAGNNLMIMGVLEVLVGGIALFLAESAGVLLGTIIFFSVILLFFSLKVALGVKKFEL